jgi:hypothetical protein
MDFSYDACLVIRDHKKFERRLSTTMAERLPGWIGAGGPVKYIDLFNCTKDEMDVLFGKHLKYWYQRKYRCVWIPQGPRVERLEPLFLELGSLRAIAELVVLSES